jgi:hypothetical protein
MTSPEWSGILELYQQIVCGGLIEYLRKQTGMRLGRGIYGPPVVLWLMMLQRLNPRGTVVSAVQLLIEGAAGPLLADGKPVRQPSGSRAGRAAIAKRAKNCQNYCADK